MQGGAVSIGSEDGGVNITRSSFKNNKGLTAGGAISVTERKVVAISSTAFESNELVLPWLATGGALYCFNCAKVDVANTTFTNNSASYGGGAAVLFPLLPSRIANSVFQHNKALPNNERARNLFAKEADASDATGWLQTQQNQQLRLGPSSTNPLIADAGYYSGGAGLYLATSSWFDVLGCGFMQNHASSGGELT
jgi:predicted outer membrane repeat protein